jgi:hypothetical protein
MKLTSSGASRRRSALKALLLAVFGGLLAIAAGFAQSVTGTITGLVKDPNGAVVPGARVVARNTATSVEDATATDEKGLYRLGNLVSGEYVVEVEAKGFRKAVTQIQRVTTGDTFRIDVTLELGKVSETVTVQASATEINTEDAQLGKTVRNISELPLLSGVNGRNVLLLGLTQNGMVTAPSDFAAGGGSYSINGQRASANNFMLDGADATDQTGGQPDAVLFVTPNAVAEFRLVTGVMKAEYGRNSGGVIMVTTKSGGNQIHGITSEIFRNTRLNAVPFFQKSIGGGTREKNRNGLPRKPVWNSNDFDVNVGGPVVRNKTFFFVSYLGFRRQQGDARSATVPSDAQRTAIEAAGTPAAKALLALVPRATSGNLLLSAPSNSLERDAGLARIDHYFSDANRFSASYFIDDQTETRPFQNANSVPGFPIVSNFRRQSLVLRDTHSFSARLLNEFRASFHRRGRLDVPVDRILLGSLGLEKIASAEPDSETPPRFNISGFTPFGVFNPRLGTWNNTFQYLDNVSWIRGRHFRKLGGEFHTYTGNFISAPASNAEVTVDGSGTTSSPPPVERRIQGLPEPLNDFANGFASRFSQKAPFVGTTQVRSTNAFFQDDWKVRPWFTLHLGLRWEYTGGMKNTHDRLVAFRLGQQSEVFPDAPLGVVYPGDRGITRSTYREDLNNISPRFGFAWDVLRSGTLSVRGGYALLYDTPIVQVLTGIYNAPPFVITAETRSTDYANPWEGSRVNPIPKPFPFHPPKRGERFDFTKIAPIGFGVVDPDLATPYVHQWSLQVQSEVGKGWLVEAGYAGNAGVKLLNQRQINPAIPQPGANTLNTNQRRMWNQGNPQNATFGGAVFGTILDFLSDANSNYHSFQVSATRRVAHGLSMTHAYSWSHSIDNLSIFGANFNLDLAGTSRIGSAGADRGNSSFDVRHRYVMTYIYEFPFRKARVGAPGHVLGGWGVSGITTFQTGQPFNITEPQDRCLCDSGGQRPDYAGGPVPFLDPRLPSNLWFDGAAFRRVGSGPSFALGAGRFGNFGRDVFHGPGINNWDFAAFKRTKISEGHTLEFRAEFLNVFNHAQFLNPNGDISQANFGRITQTRDPRIVQLSMRYVF